MTLSAIDQSFYEMYRGSISECDDDTILRFLKDNNSVDSMEGYTHLMDTYIAFKAGIEYAKPVEYIVINGNPMTGFNFYGVFKNHNEATVWGKDNFDESGFVVAELRETT
jgi:hypothetical protein